jgi:hypothetical protein
MIGDSDLEAAYHLDYLPHDPRQEVIFYIFQFTPLSG